MEGGTLFPTRKGSHYLLLILTRHLSGFRFDSNTKDYYQNLLFNKICNFCRVKKKAL